MLRSMYAGVSGLKAHMTKMDIVGNNIANVNTTGYKGSRATFKTMLSQTIQGASAPQDERGGTNPQQIGLGTSLGSIDKDMGQGNLKSTGKNTDLAIEGNGFFVLNGGGSDLYTRAGSMSFDKEGYLVNSTNGYRVRGWMADAQGNIDTNSQLEDITLKQNMEAEPTDEVNFSGNLDATAKDLTLEAGSFQVDDGSGNTDTINVSLTKQTSTPTTATWEYTLTADDPSTTLSGGSPYTGTITLQNDGTVDSITDNANEITDVAGGGNAVDLTFPTAGDDINSTSFIQTPTGDTVGADYDNSRAERTVTTPVYDSLGQEHTVSFKVEKTTSDIWSVKESSLNITDATVTGNSFNDAGNNKHDIQFDADGNISSGGTTTITFDTSGGAADSQEITLDFSEFTQFAGDMTADANTVNGYQAGNFQKFSIGQSGVLTGQYDNGKRQTVGQIALADFNNPAGLNEEGDTMFRTSNNSGQAKIGTANSGGFGALKAGTLEMSNIDLSRQFTEMITTQRGFQANSKTISTSDQILNELVNLKR